ncbi:MAG: hypothetical protein R6V17_03690, partial [Halanaerobacter sp.]
LGIKIGVELNYKINESFSLLGKSYFRRAEIDLKKEYDDVEDKMIQITGDEDLEIKGLGVSLGINYIF